MTKVAAPMRTGFRHERRSCGTRSRSAQRRRVLALCAAGAVVAGTIAAYIGVHASTILTGTPTNPAANPVALAGDLLQGRTEWTTAATVAVAALIGLPLGLMFAVALPAARAGVGRDLDQAPRSPSAPPGPQERGRPPDPQRCHPPRPRARRDDATSTRAPGIALGEAVRLNFTVLSSWEDMLLLIAGPRTMKTTAYAIPTVLHAPGAVLATSNKRDLVDVTRAARAETGQVWVFDPQAVAPRTRPGGGTP